MDWDLCRIFIAVADVGDYSGAARRLRSSHPTVGRKIASLEKELGVRLFVRTPDGLVLTEPGQRFREHAEAMASAAISAQVSVSVRGDSARGVVKLSIGPTLATHWLLPHLAAFLRARPNIALDLITYPFPASVLKRDADIVLRVFESGEENLIGRKVGRLGVGFYASRAYAERHPLPESRHDWKRHSVIGFADMASNAELGRWSNNVARHARVSLRCSTQSDMLAAARAGIGICALSCIVGDAHDDLLRVAPRKLAGMSDMWLLAHPELINLPAMRETIDFIAAQARADRDLLRGGG